MSAQHTQGPLVVRGGYSLYADDGKTPVADTCLTASVADHDDANARRLAACWNSCDGISTESLEIWSACGHMGPTWEMMIKRLGAQRDELLAALEGMHKVCEIALAGKDGKQHSYFETRAGHFVDATKAMQRAEAAIAKVQQDQFAHVRKLVSAKRLSDEAPT